MMNFVIRGENFEINESIKEYVKEKISKIKKHFLDEIDANVHVNLKVYHKGEHKAEVTIQLPHFVLRAEDNNQDVYAAIDIVADRLERQIRKHKTKINRKYREKGIKSDDFFYIHGKEAEDQESLVIKKHKKIQLQPMDEEEAILQMNLLGHNFFLYMDGLTGKTCAVYRRKGDSYGVIETY